MKLNFKSLENIVFLCNEYIVKKQYNEAFELLNKFKKENGSSLRLNFELGKILFLKAENVESIKYLKSCLNDDNLKVNVLDLLAKNYKAINDEQNFLSCCEEIIKKDKYSINAYQEIVNFYFYNKKDYKKTLFFIERFFESKKENISFKIIELESYLLIHNMDVFKIKLKNIIPFISMENIDEFIELAKFFIYNNQYVLAIDFIYEMKKVCADYDFNKSFFNNFQYDFAKYFKQIRALDNDVEKLFISFFNKIPVECVKIKNMILNELEIYRKQIKLLSKPRSITVVLTNKCNLKCKMCYVWKNIWSMTDKHIDEIKRIMPYLEYITWHGGEVFLHNRFLELFDFAQECNIQQEVITNGLLLNDKIIKKMVDFGIQLTISIDGINKDTYEKIRMGASFEKLQNNLMLIQQYRQKKESNTFRIRMNTILSRDNYLDLLSFIEFAHEYNINEIYFFPLIYNINENIELNKFVDLYTPVIEYIDKNKNEISNRAKQYNINIINTVPSLAVFNGKIKSKYDEKLLIVGNESDCGIDVQSEKMINYDKDVKNNNNRQVICTVPWQRLRLDRIIRPHCFCRGDVNVSIMNDDFDIDKLWNCDSMQAYRKMIINNDFKEYCNPSCAFGVIPQEQYNGVVL